MALPLLPEHLIEKAFKLLIEDLKKKGKIKKFQTYIEYYKKEWLYSKKWGPAKICVFQKVDRTNNPIESWHRDLNTNMKKRQEADIFLGMAKSSNFNRLQRFVESF